MNNHCSMNQLLERINDDAVVVFGTALHAAKCLYYLRNNGIRIKYFLDNNCVEEIFCGYPVYKPIKEKVTKSFILVATSEPVYLEISKQLQEYGMCEFDDYIYYEWLYKKVVLLHGNCHTIVIRSFLRSSKHFCEKYSIYPNPLIHKNKEKRVAESGIKNCDVWIHQDIQKENAFGYYLSDEYLKQKVRSDVEEIIIPNLFGMGRFLFPQTIGGFAKQKIGEDTPMFPRSDKIIDKCVENGMDKKEIEMFCSGRVMEEKEIKENFRFYIEKIREREFAWDIKILNYILEHYKEEKLFYDINHPCENVLMEISLGILKKLGIEDENIYNIENVFMDYTEEPVYPIVKEVLGLRWEKTFIRNSMAGRKLSSNMDFSEYIKEYIFWCYEIGKCAISERQETDLG